MYCRTAHNLSKTMSVYYVHSTIEVKGLTVIGLTALHSGLGHFGGLHKGIKDKEKRLRTLSLCLQPRRAPLWPQPPLPMYCIRLTCPLRSLRSYNDVVASQPILTRHLRVSSSERPLYGVRKRERAKATVISVGAECVGLSDTFSNMRTGESAEWKRCWHADTNETPTLGV